MSKHILDQKLSEAEKSQLEAFCANPLMKDTVKKVLLFPIYETGVIKKGEQSENNLNFFLNLYLGKKDWNDAELGNEVKIRAEALLLVERAFMEIEGYEEEKLIIPKKNEAR